VHVQMHVHHGPDLLVPARCGRYGCRLPLVDTDGRLVKASEATLRREGRPLLASRTDVARAAFDGRTTVPDAGQDVTDKAFARILGQEIRRAREARGRSRVQLVERLPSGIGDRTLLSYEQGLRQLSVIRFVEISRALGVAASDLPARALEKARDLRAFP
jgi:hypothetical protein